MGNVEYYNMLSIIMAVAAVAMLIMTIILWLKLNIKRDFAILTGSEARKDIERIRKEASSGTVQADLRRRDRGSIISWNTSENLHVGRGQDATTLLGAAPVMPNPGAVNPANSVPAFDPNATTVLGTNIPAGDPNATTVLGAAEPVNIPANVPTYTPTYSNNGFVVEREERT